jgi:hypothetical protein
MAHRKALDSTTIRGGAIEKPLPNVGRKVGKKRYDISSIPG